MEIAYIIFITCLIGTVYLAPLVFSAPRIYKVFLKSNKMKTILLALCSYLPFFLGYIYLYNQTKNAYLGLLLTPLYLIQYFYWILGITVLQNKQYVAAIFSICNGASLYILQAIRTPGALFGWDWLIQIPIIFIFALNHIISFVYIRRRMKYRDFEGDSYD